MSSSEQLPPITLIDLHRDTTPAEVTEFVEQTEFDRADQTRPPTPTPQEAYQAGLAEGESVGRSAALKELEPVIGRFEELMRSLAHIRERRLEETERELVEVAGEMAKRILHGELQLETDAVMRVARACLQEAKEEGTRTLRVNPTDVEMVRTHLPELELDLAEHALQIAADPAIPPSGVVLETDRCCYDGRPQRMLAVARAQLESSPETSS
jgi:flagellar assembly protein FliH